MKVLGETVVTIHLSGKLTLTLLTTNGRGANYQKTALYLAKMQLLLGQSFVLDFRPGAGGVIGSNYAARSAADGVPSRSFRRWPLVPPIP